MYGVKTQWPFLAKLPLDIFVHLLSTYGHNGVPDLSPLLEMENPQVWEYRGFHSFEGEVRNRPSDRKEMYFYAQ